MNKLKYILLLIVVGGMYSCSFVEDNVFEEENGDRVDETLREYLDLLTGAEDGWLLEYFPEDTKYGGFNLYLKFNKEGEVAITAESPILQSENECPISLYALKSEMGPVLSFDTYNRVLHQFSDPEPDGLGYEGDYEFIIMSVDSDTITLKGKKSGIKMNMIKFPADKTWQEYSKQLDKIIQHHPGFTMELQVNDTKISFSESAEIGRYLTTIDIDGFEGISYSYTSEGLVFKEPLNFNGQIIQHFVQSEDGSYLICTDENTNAKINHIPLNEAFINMKMNWFFDGEKMGPRVTEIWNELVKELDERGNEELLFVYFRSPHQLLSLYSYSRNDGAAFNANFYFIFDAVSKEEAMENEYYGGDGNMIRIDLDPKAVGDQMAVLIYYYYFSTFRRYIVDEAPYELVYNNLKMPNEILFRRLDNPERIWFILSK